MAIKDDPAFQDLETWNKTELDHLPTNKLVAVWFIRNYKPLKNGGAECMAHALNAALIADGVIVYVMCPDYPQVVYNGVRICNFESLSLRTRLAKRANVAFTQNRGTLATLEVLATEKCSLVELIHDDKKMYPLIPFPRGSDYYCLFNSNWLFDKYKSTHGKRSIVVRPPVHWSNYATYTNRKFVTLVNTCELKGGKLLPILATKIPEDQFMGVTGGWGEGIYAGNIPNLRYTKHTDDMQQDVYAHTGILIMPSRYESWGRTAVEAMACGIPVIAHPTPGLKEAIGSAGIFCDREKPEEWICAIRRLRQDPLYYRIMSDRARARARELDPTAELEQFCKWVRAIAK